jgi:hypothetical protein
MPLPRLRHSRAATICTGPGRARRRRRAAATAKPTARGERQQGRGGGVDAEGALARGAEEALRRSAARFGGRPVRPPAHPAPPPTHPRRRGAARGRGRWAGGAAPPRPT